MSSTSGRNTPFIGKTDVHRDLLELQGDDVSLDPGRDDAVFRDIGTGGAQVAERLDPEDLGAEGLEGLPGLAVVDAVAAGSLAGDGAALDQVVVHGDVRDAGRVRRAEARGADRIGDEGGQHVLLLDEGGDAVGLHLLGAEIGAQDVGLRLLDGQGLVAEGVGDGALAVHGLLDAQALRDLAERDDPVEGAGVQMGLVVALQERHAHREDGAVELLADDVVEEDGAGAQFLLDLRVIREVDGDHLEAGWTFASYGKLMAITLKPALV